MLKRACDGHHIKRHRQPPSGGCVLKRIIYNAVAVTNFQPPSGGCVLKLGSQTPEPLRGRPAAFGRLCVETIVLFLPNFVPSPAAFGRLCVETRVIRADRPKGRQPPSGGCVLKQGDPQELVQTLKPAAFGRLCVETRVLCWRIITQAQPPSGGCVLKLFKI